MGLKLLKYYDSASSPIAPRPEYSIYVFHHPSSHNDNHNDWEKKTVTTNILRAYKTAEKLSGSGRYKKIEVKRKYFDSRNNRHREMTIRMYQGEAPKGGAVRSWLRSVSRIFSR